MASSRRETTFTALSFSPIRTTGFILHLDITIVASSGPLCLFGCVHGLGVGWGRASFVLRDWQPCCDFFNFFRNIHRFVRFSSIEFHSINNTVCASMLLFVVYFWVCVNGDKNGCVQEIDYFQFHLFFIWTHDLCEQMNCVSVCSYRLLRICVGSYWHHMTVCKN